MVFKATLLSSVFHVIELNETIHITGGYKLRIWRLTKITSHAYIGNTVHKFGARCKFNSVLLKRLNVDCAQV
jgi:hypothetical protein